MALENINCPQFVDFTSMDVFNILDGADFCFEKGIVGEMDRNKDNLLNFEDEYDENEQKVIELLSMLSIQNSVRKQKVAAHCSNVLSELNPNSIKNSNILTDKLPSKTPIKFPKPSNCSTVIKTDRANENCATINAPNKAEKSVKQNLFKTDETANKDNQPLLTSETLPEAIELIDLEEEEQRKEANSNTKASSENNAKKKIIIKRHTVAAQKAQPQKPVSTLRERIANYAKQLDAQKNSKLPRKVSKASNNYNTNSNAKKQEPQANETKAETKTQRKAAVKTDQKGGVPLYRGLKFIPKIQSQFDTHQKSVLIQEAKAHAPTTSAISNAKKSIAEQTARANLMLNKQSIQAKSLALTNAATKPKLASIIPKPHTAKAVQTSRKIEAKKPDAKSNLRLAKATSMQNIVKVSLAQSKSTSANCGNLLNTELRALKRQQCETNKSDRELVADVVGHEIALHRAQAQHETEMKKMKNDLKEIKNHRPIQIRASTKPLTKPITPSFMKLKKSASLFSIN